MLGQRSGSVILLGLLSLLLLGQAPEPPAPPGLTMPLIARHLSGFGFPVTLGAAPGYVDEQSCALCHPKIAESYREKGMARAFRRPRPETDIEDFAAAPFTHAPSRSNFQIIRRGDRLIFRRWQTDAVGQPINIFEQPVDWILGSGDHARTYLYKTPGGEIYQLPLAWYSQTRNWKMAPGFDRPDHDGVLRRVRRECLFCHNSYPDVPAGADAYGAPQTWPDDLPEGIGCQRCHGPAAEHVYLALGGIGVREEIRSSIFNPGKLPQVKRDEVCQGCHLQPSVVIPGLRRFGRSDFSFRPGEPLADYLVQVDVDEEGHTSDDRFEINHHPYRLRQSRCWIASAGALSCLTCHDPHARVPESDRAAHYRAACLTCHKPDACRRPGKTMATDISDCVSCHMPKRRTQDVVHVVMTDHLIRRQPGGPELLAPLAETEPVLTGIRLIGPDAPKGALGEVYRAAAVVRATPTEDAVAYLEKTLSAARPAEIEPWLDLAQAQLRRRRFNDAEKTLTGILERQPNHPLPLSWMGLAKSSQGKSEEAIELLRRALVNGADRADVEYNLGRFLAVRGRTDEAGAHLERAVAVRPVLVAGWYYLGEARAAQDRTEEALACWRRALEIDPTHTPSYLALGKALLARGNRAEALRWLRHGTQAAARPEEVKAALRAAGEPSP